MDRIVVFNLVADMAGGLALFLFGMDTMSSFLSKMTGGFFDKAINTITRNRVTAFLFGAILTAVAQSVSSISVLTVGMVNSGIVLLDQAIGLLIGANLGTTATAWLLSLNALGGGNLRLLTVIKPSTFTPFLAIICVAARMFAKKEKNINILGALLGFSIMMIGMTMMGEGIQPLKHLPALNTILTRFANPVPGYLFAVLFTMLIQSSDATIGIVQALSMSVGVTYGMCIPIVCGAQTGTCITALISSMGTSNNGKRTALMNLYYNLLKTIPFLIIFYTVNFFEHFNFMESNVGAIGIPMVHTAINLFGSAVWLPLASFIVSLAGKTIPYSEEEKRRQENKLSMLDKNLLNNMTLALNQADRAVFILAETVQEAMRKLLEIEIDYNDLDILLDRIKDYRKQIDDYIMCISQKTMDTNEATFNMMLTNVTTAFGEIGSIVDSSVGIRESNRDSSHEALSEIVKTEFKLLGEIVQEILEFTVTSYEKKDAMLSETVQVFREEIMVITNIIQQRLIRRMHGNGRNTMTTTLNDVYYMWMHSIDYCDIVADELIKYNTAIGNPPEILYQRKRETITIRKIFEDKYRVLNIGIDENGRVIDLDE